MENEALKALNEQIATLKDLIKVQSELITELRNRPAPTQTIIHQYQYHQGYGYGYWYLGQWYPQYNFAGPGAGGGIGGNYGAQGNGGAVTVPNMGTGIAGAGCSGNFTLADVQVTGNSGVSIDGIATSNVFSIAK